MALSAKSPVLPLLILAVILDIIAVAIPYWAVIEVSNKKLNLGLWKMCVDGTCVDYPASALTEEIKTARGLHMFALVAGVITLVFYIVTQLVELLSPKIQKTLAVILSLISGAFILIADSHMAKTDMLYPGCLVPTLVSSSFFIYVAGFLTSSQCSSE